jgi:uncharacterized protein (DUF2147 family)
MEIQMKKFLLTAAVVLLSTTAYADKFNFGIKGGTASIDVPKNCRSMSCLNFSFKDKDGKVYTKDDMKNYNKKEGKVTEEPVSSPFGNNEATTNNTQPANTNPAPAPAPEANTAPRREEAPRQSTTDSTYNNNSNQADMITGPVRTQQLPPARTQEVAPAREPERVVANRPEPAPAPKAAPTGPVGEWLVEDGRAQIRIEPCGPNLCGYVSHTKNPGDTDKKNPDPKLRSRPIVGMMMMIDMKPVGERWEGKIYNSENGSSYNSKISMRNANTLRVEGCVFGGMFCGGQNWKRVL